MAGVKDLPMHIVQATKKHTATVFFFHGSGDTAEHIKSWVDIANGEVLDFPHIKLVYPTAPSQPYGGVMQNVWFNRIAISNEVPEILKSIDSMCQDVSKMIDKEVADGIPLNRIVLGGFSMGGCFALHLAYRYKANIAGCFAMSSFLNRGSAVYEHLRLNPEYRNVPLIQFHGSNDDLVLPEWAKETAENLKELGVNVQFIEMPSVEHLLDSSGIRDCKSWLYKVLPIDT